MNVTGITTVALPPSGGLNCAIATRATTQAATFSLSVEAVDAVELTLPSAAILAVTRTLPFISGSAWRPAL